MKFNDDMLYIGPGQNCGNTAPTPTPDPNATYYVTGTAELVGADKAWNEKAIAMTKNADNSFSHTFSELAAGTVYRMKLTNGTWDKVSYNDSEYYVYSYLVTPNKGDVTFTDITENNVTSVINSDTTGTNPTRLNLRTTPCYDDDLDNLGASALTKAMTTAEGVEFKVIGINETKTWAKVYFKGKDARGMDIDGEFYCRPSYLEYFKTTDGGNSGNGGVNPV